MKGKSLTGASLSLAFCLSAYLVYVDAVQHNDKARILVAALIYFSPLFIEFCENLQNMRFPSRPVFWFFLICFVLGLVFLIFLFAHLSIDSIDKSNFSSFEKFLFSFLPGTSLPIKLYSYIVAIAQVVNRNL